MAQMVEEQSLTTELSAEQSIALLDGKASKFATPAVKDQITTVGDYLPYIQVMGGSSELCKKGQFPIGHFCMMKGKQPIDLGEVFITFILAWRPKAMVFKPNTRAYFDPNSEGFKQTEERSKTPQSNCGCGPEFLLWLPEHDIVAAMFMGNASGRMESPNLIDCMEKGTRICKLKTEYVTSKRTGQSWHAPRMMPHDLQIVMPDMAKIVPMVDKFNNPPVEEEVKPEAAGTEGRG